ncbi:MAG: zinc ribbon domain-containing protein [Olsenella sp.]|nr:zinc ribbon domain-containing protein [Olsenella sp.]
MICGSENVEGAKFCTECGKPLPVERAEPESGDVAGATVLVERPAGARQCASCHALVEEGQKFCTECGAPLDDEGSELEPSDDAGATVLVEHPAGTRYCTCCGALVEEGQKFCTSCGLTLEQGSESQGAGGAASAGGAVPLVDPRKGRSAGGADLEPAPVQGQAKKVPVAAAVAAGVVVAAAIIGAVVFVPRVVGGNAGTAGESPAASANKPSSDKDVAQPGGKSGDNGAEGSAGANAGKDVDKSAAKGFSTAGNLVNGGHMALGSDGTIYVGSPVDGTDWDTRSIVRCKPDGTGSSVVYKAPQSVKNVYHINVAGDLLVFNQVAEGNSSVMSVGTDGQGSRTLDKCDDWSLCQVEGSWVYYLKSGSVCRCDVTGGSRATYANVGSSTYWRVSGDKLITFADKGATSVRISALDGSNAKDAYRAPSGFSIRNAFPMDSTNMVVWEEGPSVSRVKLVGMADGKEQTLWSGSDDIQRVSSYDGGIILTKRDASGTYGIEAYAVAGGDPVFSSVALSGDQVRYTSYLDGRVYYGLVSGDLQCSVHSMSMAGDDDRTIVS